MNREEFVEKLQEFTHEFIKSCGEVRNVGTGVTREDQNVPFNKGFGDSSYIIMLPGNFPAGSKQVVQNVLQELIDKNPSLKEGIFLEPYGIDGQYEGFNLHYKSDEINTNGLFKALDEFPQKLVSAMQNEIDNPTIEVKEVDQNCLVANFNERSSPTETTVNLAQNVTLNPALNNQITGFTA